MHISAQTTRTPIMRGTSSPTRQSEPSSASPIDQLPDLSSIEARAAQNAPATAALTNSSTLSTGKKAALLALGLGTALMAASPTASAHGYGYGYGYGYGHHHHQYQGNAGAILGGAILGAIIGGMVEQQAPPVYYPPQPVYQTPYYDNYNRLICPNQNGGWYVSPDNVRCW